jgi:hypothetical protein
MKFGSRKNREIDRIGKAILAADRLREDEIEQIASAPYLLAGIRARIDGESASTNFARQNGSTSILRPWVAYPATAALLVLMVGLILLSDRGKVNEDVFLVAPPHEIENPEPNTVIPADQPSEPVINLESRPKVRNALPVEASIREPRAKRPLPRKKPAGAPLEFYALSSAGDPAEMLKDGRIIRVDLPRTSLLSLGVNVPLESENAVVKTDLLVGSDGVTKAIRVVK